MRTVCMVKHDQCPLTKAAGERDERLKQTTIICGHCGRSFVLTDSQVRELLPGAVWDPDMSAWVQQSGVSR